MIGELVPESYGRVETLTFIGRKRDAAGYCIGQIRIQIASAKSRNVECVAHSIKTLINSAVHPLSYNANSGLFFQPPYFGVAIFAFTESEKLVSEVQMQIKVIELCFSHVRKKH